MYFARGHLDPERGAIASFDLQFLVQHDAVPFQLLCQGYSIFGVVIENRSFLANKLAFVVAKGQMIDW
jgi:hypothetical protein